MRIAHQVLSGEIAGGQLVALSLALAARDAGHDPLLVSPSPGPLLERAGAEGIRTRVVPLGRSFRIDDALRYARLLRSERCDLLHTHTHLAGNVLGRLAGRLARVPVVAHMHIENAFRAGRPGRTLQVALDDATARLCARILVVSHATRNALERQGYPRARMEVVHNGVDLRRAEPTRPAAVPAGAPLVIQVGRLAAVKGQRELVEAVARLDRAHVLLVGTDLERGGDYARELERHASARGAADRVHLLGDRGDVPQLVAAADVLALPSYAEGLPLVVLEAMAQARPVVATAVGGTPEAVVDGETGVLVPAGDVAALADALAALLGDPALARRLGEAGRRRAEERFSVGVMTRRVHEIYAEVMR